MYAAATTPEGNSILGWRLAKPNVVPSLLKAHKEVVRVWQMTRMHETQAATAATMENTAKIKLPTRLLVRAPIPCKHNVVL